MSRNFLRRYGDGGGPLKNLINPATLAWQVLLDARSINQADGSSVTSWPDTSGNNRPAAGLGPFPVLRKTGSPLGLPLVDFNGANVQLQGTLPVAQMDTTLGFTCYVYFHQDTVQPFFNDQIAIGSDTSGGWRMLPVVQSSPSHPELTMTGGPGIGSAVSSTGTHLLTCVCNPPRAGAGLAVLYYDGAAVASFAAWNTAPNTQYQVSGNFPAQNVTLLGKIGFAAFTNVAHSDHTRQGVENYLLQTWGS